MALYTNTVETTFANLATTLTGLTENSNILITDVANVTFGNAANSSGTLGYIIANNGSYLIDLSPTDFSSLTVADMTSAFENCTHLTAIGNLPTGVTNGSQMFYGCSALTAIPSSFGSTWTAMTTGSQMFSRCTALTTIPSDFGSKWTKLTDGNGMFFSCSALKTAYFLAPSCTYTDELFSSCSSLESITLTAAAYITLIDSLASYNPDTCNNNHYYGLSSTQIDNAKLYSESLTVRFVVHNLNKGMSKYFFAI